MASLPLSQAKGELQAGLTYLAFSRFRNFHDQTVDLALAPVVLVGDNGSGKTNWLEAISYFAPGSGLRQALLHEPDSLLPRNAPSFASGWAIHGRYSGRMGDHSLGTGRDPESGERERRVSRVNGAPVRSQSAFGEILAMQWLTSKMVRLFEGSPTARRRFLDRMVQAVDPSHVSRVSTYELALRQRNRLLERWSVLDSEELRWMDALEAEIAGHAVALAAARADLVARLNHEMAESPGPFPRAVLRLEGWLDDRLASAPALAIEEELRARLFSNRAEDARLAQTSFGAHKSDLGADYAGRDLSGKPLSASLCSTGEQKALVVAILLACCRLSRQRRQEAPVLLLDDVFFGLDERRRIDLFTELEDLGCQTWMTGTDGAVFHPWKGKAQFFHLDSGSIRPM